MKNQASVRKGLHLCSSLGASQSSQQNWQQVLGNFLFRLDLGRTTAHTLYWSFTQMTNIQTTNIPTHSVFFRVKPGLCVQVIVYS